MTQTYPGYSRYRSDFERIGQLPRAGGPAWLDDKRRTAFAAFEKLGFPTATRGNEKWKHSNVAPIARATFAYPFDVETNGASARQITDAAPWDESWVRLVFIDGAFSGALSALPSGDRSMRVANLADAIFEDGEVVERNLGRLASVEDDGFTAANMAFLRDGAFVRVPEDSAPPTPLHLVFVSTGRSPATVSYPRTLVIAGRHSKLTLIESYVSLTQEAYFTNAVTEIGVEEGAQVEHYRYLMESPNAFHVGTTRVTLDRQSSFNSLSFARGARLARNDLNVLLDAPGSSCVLSGLYFTSGTQHIDNHIDVDHAKPHGSSDQLFKGILADRSRAVFSGRVLVRPNAQKTLARQADKNLLMSKGARINTKPSMEIYADDVQCFHGATAGAVAEDALFYLRSRGLDEDAAMSLLVHGFASEIIERVRPKRLRDHFDRLFSGSAPGVRDGKGPRPSHESE